MSSFFFFCCASSIKPTLNHHHHRRRRRRRNIGGEMLWHNLHALMVTCWEEEFVPEEWREGIIVPLQRKWMSVIWVTIGVLRWVVI